MILQKCKRGHYFDHDKFAECPFCALEKSVTLEKTQEFSDKAFEETETLVDTKKSVKRG